MRKKDMFSANTFVAGADEELVVQKSAIIHARGVPRLEAHGRSKPLSNRAFGIGRDKHNAVIISDPKVSKFHATIKFKGGTGYVRDGGSTNGTHLNGERIVANKDIALKNKDVIIVGSTRLTYYC